MKVSKEFEEALKNKNYSSILRLFNEKGQRAGNSIKYD